jgi:dephospho-CoA kinase
VTRVIGLTGGIGTGKSTVSAMLVELGARVIDSDRIVHELQAPGAPLLREIAAAFGEDLIRPDGSLDRAALGERVFRDDAARLRLNAIVHPAVGRESLRRLEEARASGVPLVVLDIPLLFETRLHGTASRANLGVEAVVVVYCPRELQIQRQLERNGYGREEAERRVAAQIPIEEKRARADHVIDNSGSLEETRRQVKALYESLVGAAPAARERAC